MKLEPIAGRVPIVVTPAQNSGEYWIVDSTNANWRLYRNGEWSREESYTIRHDWPTEAAARAFARECAEREGLNPKGNYMIDKPDGTAKADNDTLADMAAVELLHVLETPIQGRPSATLHNYENARRLVKAALLAVFEARKAQP